MTDSSSKRFSEEKWTQLSDSLRTNFRLNELSDTELQTLVESSPSLEDLICLEKTFYRHSKNHPHHTSLFQPLAQKVDRSPFSLGDWIQALARFETWLEEHQKQADYLEMLEYLSCCVAALKRSQPQSSSLSGLLLEMLHQHGFDQARSL